MATDASSICEVEGFLRAYAHPALAAAGFRRRGRQYSSEGPDGRIAFVAFRSFGLPQARGFYCAYGMVTPSHLAWWQERGATPASVPLLGLALVHVQLDAPDPRRSERTAGRPDWWGLYADPRLEKRGERLQDSLVETVIPDLRSWFDAEVLAVDIARHRAGLIPLMNPWPRAEAMAWLDVEGADAGVEEALARLPPNDMVRVWVKDRLDGLRAKRP